MVKSKLKLANLPTTLLALLLALPAFSSDPSSSSTYTTAPTNKSPNDPFRHILLNTPKKPGPPICCLKPLTPLEPVDDGILLSFEEWKARQLAVRGGRGADEGGAEGAEHDAPASGSDHQHDSPPNNVDGDPSSHTIPSDHASSHDPGGGGGGGGGVGGDAPTGSGSTPIIIPPNTATSLVGGTGVLSPHFRVPLTDRFNYANLDCSARIHTAHKQAKSPSSILSSKKDRYMLAPCNPTAPHGPNFVVAELCDDIRIDTVQLANFEFFSGVFKDFSVSVAKTYSSDPEDGTWTRVGTYRAKNVRGVQSFHPPMELRGFYRFIRIEFHSYYGNEYYCPVSLLRVYGLTHLEEWKWEVWEAESRERMRAVQQKQMVATKAGRVGSGQETMLSSVEVENVPSAEPVAVVGEEQQQQHASTVTDGPLTTATPLDATTHSDSADTFSTSISTLPHSPSHTPTHDGSPSEQHPTPSAPHLPQHTFPNITALANIITKVINISHAQSQHSTSSDQSQSQPPHSNTVSSAPPSTNLHTTSNSINNSHSHSPSPSASQTQSAVTSNMSPTVIISTDSASVTSIPSSHLPPPPPSGHSGGGGESIYRMIMNRLVGVETNHTLYTKYMEQQHTALRDVIKRMGEDIGRLEGLGRAQSITYQKALADWERQRFQLEMDQADLLSRLDLLSEEVILEKRLGIAQLCLLLVVLVFMGLTRGSRADTMASYTPPPTATTAFNVKEWGRRQLSLRTDWANRFTPTGSGVVTPREATAPIGNGNGSGPGQQAAAMTTAKSGVDTPSGTGLESTRWGQVQTAPSNKSFAFPALKEQHQRTNRPLEPINLNHLAVPHTSVDFGTASSQNRPPRARTRSGNNPTHHPNASSSASSSAHPRSRTPSLRSLVTNRRPNARAMGAVTPTRSIFAMGRPQMLQRSSSHGGPGVASVGGGSAGMVVGAGGLPLPFPLALASGLGSGLGVGGTGSGYVPRSARKWARTAHLHQVPRKGGNGNGNGGLTVSASASVSASRSGSPGKEKERVRREELSSMDIPGFGREVEVSEDERERDREMEMERAMESPPLDFALSDPPKASRRRRVASLKAKGVLTESKALDRNGVAVPHGVESGVVNGQTSTGGGDAEEPDAWVDTDSLDGSEFGFGTGCDAVDI